MEEYILHYERAMNRWRQVEYDYGFKVMIEGQVDKGWSFNVIDCQFDRIRIT